MIFNNRQQEDTTWLSISDLMTILMAIFLIISVIVSISSTRKLSTIQKAMEKITDKEQELCDDLRKNIFGEENIFKNYEKDNHIVIDCRPPIKVVFTHKDMLFVSGEETLKPEFKDLLEIFWPIYIKTVKNSYISQIIDEIRIEGHTDPDFKDDSVGWAPYTWNIDLSQKRSREVVRFIYEFEREKSEIKDLRWLEKRLTANGLSYSRPLQYKNGKCNEVVDLEKILVDPVKLPGDNEDKSKDCSRRVEIVLRTNSYKVIELLEDGFKSDG